MQITKLVLENFSSYEGKNTFDLKVKKNRPIILIGGQNGAGKTSIFTAVKIALYGPLAFGYTGNNSFYSKKIRGFINARAFQAETFSSSVKIEIKTKKERDIRTYTIERKWSINDSRIDEEYNVYEGKEKLGEAEKILFESYILSIIPVELFDFFLFDGEEVGNIFASDGYNKYVKKAMLTMCGIDDLEILQHFCKNYIGRNDSDDTELTERYELILGRLSEISRSIEESEKQLSAKEEEISQLNTIIEQREAEFVRSGGLPAEEAKKLEERLAADDKKREKLAHDVKAFFEEDMPFFIMGSMIPDLKKQIKYEEKAAIHEYVTNMLSQDFINSVIADKTEDSESISAALYDAVAKRFQVSNGVVDDMIFDLSRAEMGQIMNLAESIAGADKNVIIEKIAKKDELVRNISAGRQKLRNALSEEDARRFTDEITNARHRIEILELETQQKQNELAELNTAHQALSAELNVLKEKIRASSQDKHVIELSGSISLIMESLIGSSMTSIRRQLAEKTIENLHQIYRKDNLISIIDISDNFRFELYQKQSFSMQELRSLIANVGSKEFYRIIGDESIRLLREHFDLDDGGDVETAVNFSSEDGELELYKRIELNMLSKGERQIFILALYWAIIQISGKQIPFIIDTPYARIDANHREEISSKFFPNISSQVVILSTDEEITREYYKIIKPYISKEYLLTNDQSENKTTVTNGYFFEDD